LLPFGARLLDVGEVGIQLPRQLAGPAERPVVPKFDRLAHAAAELAADADDDLILGQARAARGASAKRAALIQVSFARTVDRTGSGAWPSMVSA
jgi:hypothetical protein